tara:strand:+ start:1229 stop:1345 length:117 start_codon:yes stop_codon:yes gene_type:complete
MLEDIKQLIEGGTELYIIEQVFNLTGDEMDAILGELGL